MSKRLLRVVVVLAGAALAVWGAYRGGEDLRRPLPQQKALPPVALESAPHVTLPDRSEPAPVRTEQPEAPLPDRGYNAHEPQDKQQPRQSESAQDARDSPAEQQARLSSPAEVMRDVAIFWIAHYLPATQGEGRLDLRLADVMARYAPQDLPPGMVYAVSPAMLRLGYLLTAGRFVEVLQQEAAAQLPPDAVADFMRQTAHWLQGVAICPAVVDGGGDQSSALQEDDCRQAMQWLRGSFAGEGRGEVESTAGELLLQLAGTLEHRAATLQAAR